MLKSLNFFKQHEFVRLQVCDDELLSEADQIAKPDSNLVRRWQLHNAIDITILQTFMIKFLQNFTSLFVFFTKIPAVPSRNILTKKIMLQTFKKLPNNAGALNIDRWRWGPTERPG